MTITDRLRSLFRRRPVTRAIGRAFSLVAGRLTSDIEHKYYGGYNFHPRRAYNSLDISTFFDDPKRIYSYAEILAILPDIDPDLSFALHNVTRLINSDYTLAVHKVGQSDVVHTVAQQRVEDFLKTVNKQYGGISNLIVQFAQSGYLQGAIAAEAVFDKTKLKVIDVVAVNPYTIHFRKDEESKVWPYQYQPQPKDGVPVENNNYVRLNPETFWYIPVDPAIGDPYGRGPATAAIADIFFTMRVLYDLRKVIHNQGWPRIDVTVMSDILKKMAPDSMQDDAEELAKFINARISEIQTAYNSLNPDDTYVHSDGVQVEMKGIEGGKIFDPGPLLLSLERRVIRGLKQLPLLMGSNEGTTETHGTLQFAIYAKGIEAFQKMIEDLLEGVLELMLRMEGIQAAVTFEFERVRTTERLTDAQAESAEIENEIKKVNQGWISNDDASIAITGSEAFGEPIQQALTDEASGEEKAPDTKAKEGNAPLPATTRAAKPKRLTLAGQRRKFTKIANDFRNAVSDAFGKIEDTFPTAKVVEDVYAQYPLSPENTLQATRELRRLEKNKLDTNNPMYQSIVGVVERFFDQDKTQAILENLSEEGASLILAAYENYAQDVLIRLAEKDEKFKYAQFRLDDPGQQRLIEDRANFFPQSSFETAKRDIAKTVMRGYSDAKSVGEIATDLRAKFNELRTSRSELIANMELNWATSQGTLETMRRNKVAKKRWQTVEDENVRPEHMDNQNQGPIPVDQAFRGTGDMAPPAGFNCRCTVLEVVDEDWLPPAEIWTGNPTF